MKERFKYPQNESDNGGPYVQIQLPDGSWVLKHRYVMEKYLSRSIPEDCVVHHKDRRRTNNEIENLLLMKSDEEHRALHRAMAATNQAHIDALETQAIEFMRRLKAGLPLEECYQLPDPSKPVPPNEIKARKNVILRRHRSS